MLALQKNAINAAGNGKCVSKLGRDMKKILHLLVVVIIFKSTLTYGCQKSDSTIFDCLSLPSTATESEIQKGFHKKALKIHPDRFTKELVGLEGRISQEEWERRWQEIQEPFQRLNALMQSYRENPSDERDKARAIEKERAAQALRPSVEKQKIFQGKERSFNKNPLGPRVNSRDHMEPLVQNITEVPAYVSIHLEPGNGYEMLLKQALDRRGVATYLLQMILNSLQLPADLMDEATKFQLISRIGKNFSFSGRLLSTVAIAPISSFLLMACSPVGSAKKSGRVFVGAWASLGKNWII